MPSSFVSKIRMRVFRRGGGLTFTSEIVDSQAAEVRTVAEAYHEHALDHPGGGVDDWSFAGRRADLRAGGDTESRGRRRRRRRRPGVAPEARCADQRQR